MDAKATKPENLEELIITGAGLAKCPVRTLLMPVGGQKKEILIFINNKINLFIKDLEEKINVLKNIDIESKKAEDKIKSITDEGRKKYLGTIEIFIENLNKLKKDNLEKFVEDIIKIFLSFNKSSRMSYERATILIGKEMENIKETIWIFSKEIIRIFDENKKIINSSKIFYLVKIRLNKINEIKREIEGINETITSLDKKIIDKKEENKKLLKKIEEIKRSSEYLENMERENKINLLEEELENDILSLKQIIDFKSLSGFFHIFKEEMKIVRLHKEDFQNNFKKDYGESILRLLNEAKLNSNNINERINNTKVKKEEISKNKHKIKKYATSELYSEITKIILEIGNLNNEKEKEEKRVEKLKYSKEEIIKEIKSEIEELNVNII